MKTSHWAMAAVGLAALSIVGLRTADVIADAIGDGFSVCTVQVIDSELRIAERIANAATGNKVGVLIEALAALDWHHRGLPQSWEVETAEETQP